jgi:hypothetical protein
VEQSPAGKNVSTKAEDIVVIRHQATTCEDTAGREDLERSVVICRVCVTCIVTCDYDLLSVQ